ncbi:MAG: CBS domain-containing protein [Promethearchaeota archaeon]|nr:MAG: CBS domain-containing protein [Candidatus Lokiarchaeota archaeon]
MVKLSTIARKNIIFCKKEDTVDTIATIMVRHHIGCVLVKDTITEEFIGLIDDRMLFRLLTLGENPIPKTAEEIMIPLHLIEGELEIEDDWHKMENSNAERFCVTENERVIGIVKKKTVGMLRLKHLKQKLGIIDV